MQLSDSAHLVPVLYLCGILNISLRRSLLRRLVICLHRPQYPHRGRKALHERCRTQLVIPLIILLEQVVLLGPRRLVLHRREVRREVRHLIIDIIMVVLVMKTVTEDHLHRRQTISEIAAMTNTPTKIEGILRLTMAQIGLGVHPHPLRAEITETWSESMTVIAIEIETVTGIMVMGGTLTNAVGS